MKNKYFSVKECPDYCEIWYGAGYHNTYGPGAVCAFHHSNLGLVIEALSERPSILDQLNTFCANLFEGNKITKINFAYEGVVFPDQGEFRPSPEGTVKIHMIAVYDNCLQVRHPQSEKIAQECAKFLQGIWHGIVQIEEEIEY